MELLVVLAIMGLLASLSLPAMKGIGQSNLLTSATRQIRDDLALARQLAIKDRTIIHVVFVPTNVFQVPLPGAARERAIMTNLLDGAYTTYAMFSERSPGDQPGNPHFRYARLWRSLPDGTMFSFRTMADLTAEAARPFALRFPFPTSDGATNNPPYVMPYLSFDETGTLLRYDNMGKQVLADAELEVTRGSVFPIRDPNGLVIDLDVQERPPDSGTNNVIVINALTGRASLVQPQIQ